MLNKKQYIYKATFYLRLYLIYLPKVYLILFRILKQVRKSTLRRQYDFYSAYPVDGKTDIVIEGFPRCANSFCIRAFYFNGQNKGIRVAHHLHSSAQVLYAVQYKIPTLVLIRKPEDAILSYLLRTSFVTPKMAIKAYIQFYSMIESHREQYVLADFREVVKDFGKVIERVNTKYNSSFDVFNHSKENVEECFRLCETRSKSMRRGHEEMLARPSAIKEEMKNNMRSQLKSEDISSLLAYADNLYDSFSHSFP